MSQSDSEHTSVRISSTGQYETSSCSVPIMSTSSICDQSDELSLSSSMSENIDGGTSGSDAKSHKSSKSNRGPPPPVPVKPPRVHALGKAGRSSSGSSNSSSSSGGNYDKCTVNRTSSNSESSGSYNSATSASNPSSLPENAVQKPKHEKKETSLDDHAKTEIKDGHSPTDSNTKDLTLAPESSEPSTSTFKIKNVEIFISDCNDEEGLDEENNLIEEMVMASDDNLIPLINDLMSPCGVSRPGSKSPNNQNHAIINSEPGNNDDTCITGCSWEMDEDDDGTDCSTSSSYCSGMGNNNDKHGNQHDYLQENNAYSFPSSIIGGNVVSPTTGRKATVGCGMVTITETGTVLPTPVGNTSSSSITTTCAESHIKDQIVVVKLAAKVVQCPSAGASVSSPSASPAFSTGSTNSSRPPPPPIPSYPDSSTATDTSSSASNSNPLEGKEASAVRKQPCSVTDTKSTSLNSCGDADIDDDDDDPGKDGNEPDSSTCSELYQNMVVAHGLMIGRENGEDSQVFVQQKVVDRQQQQREKKHKNNKLQHALLPTRPLTEGQCVDDVTEEERLNDAEGGDNENDEYETEPCYQNIIVKKGKFAVSPKKSNIHASCDPTDQNVSLLERSPVSGNGGERNMITASIGGAGNLNNNSHNGCNNNCRGISTRIMELESLNTETPVPVVHAVINLPPRKANLIKERRRSRFENMSYQKSARINQMMVAEFKSNGNDRPCSVSMVRDGKVMSVTTSNNYSDVPSSDAEHGSIIGKVKIGFGLNKAKSSLQKSKSAVTSQVEKAKKKMGSWYQRRVKTPVEQLGTMRTSGSSSRQQDNESNGSRQERETASMERSGGGGGGRQSSIYGRSIRSMTSTPADMIDLEEERDEPDGPEYSNVVYDRKSHLTDINWEDGGTEHEFEVEQHKKESEEEDSFKTKGQNEFEELRRVVKQGGDFCKDLAAVLQERSELEAQYAKGLSKLSAKLLKASKEATGSVAHAWQAVAVQIDTQAELHRQWSTALSEEVARPLRSSLETQHKIRKSVEVLVEKTTRNLAEWRTAESKAKRQCFSSSKEFEKLQENSSVIVNNNLNAANSTGGTANAGNGGANSASSNASNIGGSNLALAEVRTRSRLLSVPPMDKDPIKQEAKRRKAEEAVRRADIEYYTFCVRSERARLEWESAIRNGSTCLRTLEEEKLSLLRDLAIKYHQFLNELAPRQVQSVESLEDPVKNCSVNQDMHAIVDIRRHAGAEQLLPDFYAEDTSNLMKRERRQEALQKFLYLVNQDLEREKKGAIGIETLAKAIAEAPKIDTAHHDISDKLYYVKSMLMYLEAARTKVDNALADIEGRQRTNNPITQYMRHQRDKQGFPQTILKVPSWAKDECLAFFSGGISGGSHSPDWNDRGNGDGTSGQHETDFDEFSSQDSGCDHNTDSCGEESNKAASNLINTPSIGKCRAIYDYDANLFDELTIRIGDVINIHDKQEDGWWLGEINGIIGIFPATYVEEISVAESTTSGD